MPTSEYGFNELKQLWTDAGGPRGLAAIMAAIALAESSGNRFARNVTPKEDSRGLWQINVRAHPQYAHANLTDPRVNAQAAVAVWRSQGLGAWSTYTNGSYQTALKAALFHDSGGGIGGAVSGVVHGVGGALGGAAHAVTSGAGTVFHAPEHAAKAAAEGVEGTVKHAETWAEGAALRALGYVVLTVGSLVLFGLGISRVTGLSAGLGPVTLGAPGTQRVPVRTGGGDEIPF